jgi:7-keto-8-aminopelargonate synthetase-like enzyme
MTKTVDLARRFLDRTIVTTPFIEPSVPPNKGALRLIPQAGLGRDDIRAVLRAIRSIDGWLNKE